MSPLTNEQIAKEKLDAQIIQGITNPEILNKMNTLYQIVVFACSKVESISKETLQQRGYKFPGQEKCQMALCALRKISRNEFFQSNVDKSIRDQLEDILNHADKAVEIINTVISIASVAKDLQGASEIKSLLPCCFS